MTDEDILPAINFQEQIEQLPNELSETEFQTGLTKWFEERGLLAELRAHLRKQMIGALKNTPIGSTVNAKDHQTQSLSPKVQALNLMIAEFLLNQNYHYSLSVFSTEVPLISVIPEFPGISWNECRKIATKSNWRFSTKDMWDILETIGISRDTEMGKNIYESYYNNTNKEALLNCVVRVIHVTQTKFQEKAIEPIIVYDDYQVWIKKICEILTNNNVSNNNIKEILNIIINVIEGEKKLQEEKSQESLVKMQMHFQTEAVKNEEELNKKWSFINNTLQAEKIQIQNETSKRQIEILNLEAKIEKNQAVLKERYQEICKREMKIKQLEYNLQEKEKLLQKQEEHLENDKKITAELQEQLSYEMNQKQIIAKCDAEFLKNLQNECKNVQNEIMNSQEVLVTANQEDIEDMIKQLRIENTTLKGLSLEQKIKIDELSNTAETLKNDLETAQTVIKFLSNNITTTARETFHATPLHAPKSLKLKQHHSLSNNAEGDPGKEFQNKKQIVTQKCVQSFASSDGNFPTSDILQETRDKLKRLEEESDEVDRRYKEFKKRQCEEQFASVGSYASHVVSERFSKAVQELNIKKLPTLDEAVLLHNPQFPTKNGVPNLLESENNYKEVDISNMNKEEVEIQVHELTDADDDEVLFSSDINDLLADGTSGVSISGVDFSDGKSESQCNAE